MWCRNLLLQCFTEPLSSSYLYTLCIVDFLYCDMVVWDVPSCKTYLLFFVLFLFLDTWGKGGFFLCFGFYHFLSCNHIIITIFHNTFSLKPPPPPQKKKKSENSHVKYRVCKKYLQKLLKEDDRSVHKNYQSW